MLSDRARVTGAARAIASGGLLIQASGRISCRYPRARAHVIRYDGAARRRCTMTRIDRNPYETLNYQIADRILTLTLNRPDRLNAFTVTMCEELVDAFDRASDDDQIGAVVVTGAGRAFCAGMDLSVEGNVFGLDDSQEPTRQDLDERLDDPAILRGVRDTGGRVALAIYGCLKPVIAAINGTAVGIGATMTLPMDVRLAAEGTRIGFVFGRLGIVPEACSSWFLPRLVGVSKALEWCYEAALIDIVEARAAGLIRTILPADRLLEEAYRLAHRFIDGKSPAAIAMTRQLLWRSPTLPHPLDAHKLDSLTVFYLQRQDGREGVRAFREKRPPEFRSQASSDLPPFAYEWLGKTRPPR